jgi:uncharacterized protein
MRSFLMGILASFTLLAGIALADDAPLMKIEPLTVATSKDAVMFQVEIADTPETQERGLMFRQRLPADHGMLFDFHQPKSVAMWMKNTLIPLDMIFIRADGTIAGIARNTKPQSLDVLGVGEPILAVLEVAGGTSARIGLQPGDLVYHRIFKTAE